MSDTGVEVEEGVVMSVTAGVMCLVAGAGALLALGLPGTPRERMPLLLGLAAIALAYGFLVVTLRFPRPDTPLRFRAGVTAILIAVVGVALWASGGARSCLQPILIFTALHVGYFYPPRLAWPLNAWLVLAYATPLLYDDRAVAEAYPGRVLRFATAVAGSAVIVRQLKGRLVSAERHQRAMAERDPLTGLCNRRAFDAALARAIAEHHARGRGAALLLLDFDDFKGINDTHGHPVGDAVLCEVATACASVVRDMDCLARIGGDEFALLAPGAGAAGAERLADALEEAIAEASVPEPLDGVGVTIAWAVAGEDAAGAAELMDAADRRLMARKRRRKRAVPA